MLHHAEMHAHDRALLAALLGASARHPRARWVSMGEIPIARKPPAASSLADRQRQMS
jgi:hypothetical protein